MAAKKTGVRMCQDCRGRGETRINILCATCKGNGVLPVYDYGLPSDLTPGDVKALFSMPDDDDTCHQQGS